MREQASSQNLLRMVAFAFGCLLIAARVQSMLYHIPFIRSAPVIALVAFFFFYSLYHGKARKPPLLIFLFFLLVLLMLFGSLYTHAPISAFKKIVLTTFCWIVLVWVVYQLVEKTRNIEYLFYGLLTGWLILLISSLLLIGNPFELGGTWERHMRLSLGVGNPFVYSQYLGWGIFLSIWYCLKTKKPANLLWAIPASFTALAFIILSGSKGPLLALAAGVFALGWTYSRHRILSTLLIATLIFLIIRTAAATLPSEFILERYDLSRSGSIADRLALYSDTMARIADFGYFKIFFGAGTGGYGYAVSGEDIHWYPHNIFIETIFELGFVGLLLISIILIMPLWTLRKVLSRLRQRNLKKDISTISSLVALYFFVIMNAQIGGDLADNWFIGFFGIVLVSAQKSLQSELRKSVIHP